jgi:hypothetical protein
MAYCSGLRNRNCGIDNEKCHLVWGGDCYKKEKSHQDKLSILKKEAEKNILEKVIGLAASSLDPERFEVLTDALNQVAKNRGIDFKS